VDGEVIQPRSTNLVEPAKKGILPKVSFDKKSWVNPKYWSIVKLLLTSIFSQLLVPQAQ
jgi:hypothetical protein